MGSFWRQFTGPQASGLRVDSSTPRFQDKRPRREKPGRPEIKDVAGGEPFTTTCACGAVVERRARGRSATCFDCKRERKRKQAAKAARARRANNDTLS